MYRQWVLTALLAWPVIAAVVVLLAPVRWARHVALAASLVEFAISVPLWWTFAPAEGMQFMLDVSWIPSWGTGKRGALTGISRLLFFPPRSWSLLSFSGASPTSRRANGGSMRPCPF